MMNHSSSRSCGHGSNHADLAFAQFRRTRDPNALSTVVHAASQPLLCAARALTRDAESAEELVQTTLVAAIDGAASYDPRHPVVPWLLGILANRARRQRRFERRLPDVMRLPRETPTPDPRETIVQREFMHRVIGAVGTLPELYQPVLDLHLNLGMTPIEIAGALRRPRSTVRTQLARGLAKLRDMLEPQRDAG